MTHVALTWGAGAAYMKGIIDLSDSILDDVLCLGDGSLQQGKLLLQKPLLQLLLPTYLHTQTTNLIRFNSSP